MHTTTGLAQEAMTAGPARVRLAHALLFERVMARIHRFFRRQLPTEDAARECLQDTLLLLEESLREEKYDPERSFNTWLWLKARTVYAQWCRAQQRRMQGLPETPLHTEGSEGHIQARLDGAVLLEELRRELGAEVHEVFILYYEGDLTQAEVAEVVDRDRKTVRKRLEQAHTFFDRRLSKRI